MVVLIISDTHGRLHSLDRVALKVRPDLCIHLGDSDRQEDEIRSIVGCPLHIISGNCDWYSELPAETVIMLGKHRVLLTHGHLHHVKYDDLGLVSAAKARDCDTVLYGHTHVPEIEHIEGITIVNPGSFSLPRQADGRKSYAVCDVDREGDLHFNINYL